MQILFVTSLVDYALEGDNVDVVSYLLSRLRGNGFSPVLTRRGRGVGRKMHISHPMSSCRFCDEIIVFENGQIVERGSHEELFAAGGSYAEMWNAQARYYT